MPLRLGSHSSQPLWPWPRNACLTRTGEGRFPRKLGPPRCTRARLAALTLPVLPRCSDISLHPNDHVSSGGLSPTQQIPVGPSYQVPLARAVKAAVKMPVVAVGLITEFEQAEAIIGTGDADLIALARTILYNPRWPWHAAAYFGATVAAPSQYLRSQPARYRGLFDVRTG